MTTATRAGGCFESGGAPAQTHLRPGFDDSSDAKTFMHDGPDSKPGRGLRPGRGLIFT
jgi:hypothetical protein